MPRNLLTVMVVLLLAGACAGRPDQANHQQDQHPVATVRDLYAVGTAITQEGAVPRDASGETFRRGGEVFLSVNVSGASTDQAIEVQWVDADGRLLRRDAMEVPKGSMYAAFSSGETARWRQGQHRAVVIINGRRVGEREFALI